MDYETFQREQNKPSPYGPPTGPFKPMPTSQSLREAVRARAASAEPTGVAAALYAIGMLGLIAGGIVFAGADTSIHEIAAVLIVVGGLVSFSAGALLTELQRIKTVLLMGLPPVE